MARHRRPKAAAKAAPPAGQPRLGASTLSTAVAPGIFPARQFVVYVAPASLGTHAFPAAAEPRARRRAAGALLRLLRALPGVSRVQRGGSSGDAFLQPGGVGGAEGGFARDNLALSAALALADGACAAAASQLGIALGAGVAPNKLLARLACRSSAPAGVGIVHDASAAAHVLAAAPAAALPGAAPLMPQLAAAGLTTASAVARSPAPSLAALLGCTPAAAVALLAASRGVCPDGPVTATEASSNVHVVLEPPAAAAPADGAAHASAEEEDALLGAAFARLGAELAAAVVDDAAEWLRWPTTMAVTVDCDPPLPLCPSRKLAFPPPPRGWPPRGPPAGGPPELDAAAEAQLSAEVADAAAASFRRARGAGPRPRVMRLMLLAAKFQDAAAVAAAQEVPLAGLKFSELPSPVKRARLEAAVALGAKPINVPDMMLALLVHRTMSAEEVSAAIDAAEDRVAKELARRGGAPAW